MSITDGYITTADGVRLFFQTLGSGPKTLIILNGFTLLDDFKYLGEDHTIVALDLRSRGRSDFVTDNSKLSRGVQHDVDDLETVRQYFELDQINLLGHSYAGVTVILYALKFPERVDRIVQIGAMAPDSSKRYPAHLTNTDSTLQEFFVKMQELEKERASTDPIQFCKKFWSLLRPIYVANPADADKLKWENCHLITERSLMPHLMNNLLPSIHKARITAASAAGMKASVLTVHGTKDRSSPYGGALDWVSILPNARLLTVEGAAHAPWIEAPEKVFGAVRAFLKGSV